MDFLQVEAGAEAAKKAKEARTESDDWGRLCKKAWAMMDLKKAEKERLSLLANERVAMKRLEAQAAREERERCEMVALHAAIYGTGVAERTDTGIWLRSTQPSTVDCTLKDLYRLFNFPEYESDCQYSHKLI